MNPNCVLCHGEGWYWAQLHTYANVGEFQRPCPECNPNVRKAWMEAGEQGRLVHRQFKGLEASRENRHEPKVRYQQEWLGEKLIEEDKNGIAPIPCVECGIDVIEFSVPNDIWNRVIRPDGHEHDKEYLCMHCFLNRLRTALELPVKDDPFRE